MLALYNLWIIINVAIHMQDMAGRLSSLFLLVLSSYYCMLVGGQTCSLSGTTGCSSRCSTVSIHEK